MTAMDNMVFQISKMWQDSGLASILAKIRDSDKVDESELNEILANTFKAAEDRLADGFQLWDIIPILSAALKDIMEVAEKIDGATGAEKLDFVVVMFSNLYQFVDKGVDGTKNRIDIPWVPQVAEDFLEKRVLPVAVRFAAEAVVAVWNERTTKDG